jgi:NADPH2:quinone reductase
LGGLDGEGFGGHRHRHLLDLTSGNGVAAVFDSLGKSAFDASLQCVARKGSMVSFGNTTGTVELVDIM